jgi:hypothetical protein
MTQEEIIEMAKQAGMDYLQYLSPEAFEKVVAFAKLVAQHEREACAKVCEMYINERNDEARKTATKCVIDIRARGQA